MAILEYIWEKFLHAWDFLLEMFLTSSLSSSNNLSRDCEIKNSAWYILPPLNPAIKGIRDSFILLLFNQFITKLSSSFGKLISWHLDLIVRGNNDELSVNYLQNASQIIASYEQNITNSVANH